MGEWAASSGTSSGQVGITLTIGEPSGSTPGVATPGPPSHLAFTGAPLVAELDLALLAVVAGMALVTASKRLASLRRAQADPWPGPLSRRGR